MKNSLLIGVLLIIAGLTSFFSKNQEILDFISWFIVGAGIVLVLKSTVLKTK